MSGFLLTAPLLLTAVCAAVLVAALATTAVRARELPRTVTAARRHGTAAGALAVLAGLAAGAAAAAGDPVLPLAPGTGLLAAPLAFALAHTLVLVAAEAAWPRPRGVLRSAVLTARTAREVAPAGLRRLLVVAATTVAAVGAAGWATAGDDGRSVVAGGAVPLPHGGSAGPVTTGPYPGAAYAVPALLGAALVVALVAVALRVVAARPAVDGADRADEAVLRRASAHRVLRGACAGLLATAAGLLWFGGTALHRAALPLQLGLDGVAVTAGGSPALVAVGTAAAVAGAAALVVALVVLVLPAPRLATAARASAAGRGAAPAPRGVA